MFRFNLRGFTLSLAVLGVMLFGAASTKADQVTFDINEGSTLPDVHYGFVTFTLVGSSIQVSVDLTDSGAKLVNTGLDASVAFNFNGIANPTLTITGLPATYSAVNGGAPSVVHMDGFGNFEYGVLFGPNGGGAGTDSTLTFTVSRVGGFSTVAELLELSTGGGLSSAIALDVIFQGNTGAVGGTIGPVINPQGTVPEPASMLLLGTGLVGAAAGLRRRRNKQS